MKWRRVEFSSCASNFSFPSIVLIMIPLKKQLGFIDFHLQFIKGESVRWRLPSVFAGQLNMGHFTAWWLNGKIRHDLIHNFYRQALLLQLPDLMKSKIKQAMEKTSWKIHWQFFKSLNKTYNFKLAWLCTPWSHHKTQTWSTSIIWNFRQHKSSPTSNFQSSVFFTRTSLSMAANLANISET